METKRYIRPAPPRDKYGNRKCSGHGPTGMTPHFTSPSNFNGYSGTADELQAMCNKCFPYYHIWRQYGLMPAEHDKLVREANGHCQLCNCPFTENNGPKIDHCHDSKQVRGLICHSCNVLLGHAHDSVRVLEKAILYLRKDANYADKGRRPGKVPQGSPS